MKQFTKIPAILIGSTLHLIFLTYKRQKVTYMMWKQFYELYFISKITDY